MLIAVFWGDRQHVSVGKWKIAFATRSHDEPLNEGGPKKPASEDHPCRCLDKIFGQPGHGPGRWRAGEVRQEESCSGPTPSLLDEVYIHPV